MNNIKLLPSLMVFAEVAQRRSFTAAATHLKMSKSAISQHVTRLEGQIGSSLLNRHTRGMSLTSMGARLLARSEIIAGQVDLTLLEIAAAEHTPSGMFSVTSPNSLEEPVLVPALSQLAIEFPKLEPRLVTTDAALDLIAEKLDASIFVGELKDSAYRALPLGSLREIFCATPTYLHRHGTPTSLKEISNKHRWISIPWQNHTIQVERKGHRAESTKLKPYAQSNTLSGALEMALHHMGIVLLPEIAAYDKIQKGLLTPILKDTNLPVWKVSLVHPYQGKKPIHVTRFHELVKHYFQKAKTAA